MVVSCFQILMVVSCFQILMAFALRAHLGEFSFSLFGESRFARLSPAFF